MTRSNPAVQRMGVRQWLEQLRQNPWRFGAGPLTDPTQFPFRIDLHVHLSALGENDDRAASAALLESLMRARRLTGLVLCDHDRLPDAATVASINRGLRDRRAYRAVEISTSEGHCLVVGLDEDDLADIEPGLSTWELVKIADRHDAAVVLVHPAQPTPLTPVPKGVADMAPGIHGVEVMSCVTNSTEELEARLSAHERGWTMVAGSDALTTDRVGSAFCAFPRLPADEQDLAVMIRVGALRAERAG